MSLAVRGVAWIVLLVATACSPAKTSQPGSPPTTATAPEPAPVAQGGGFTCWQILQCYGPCGADAACLDGCLQRGDPTAQAQVNAVIECSTRCNNESECVRASCAGQVATCQATGVAAASAPPPTLAPPHSTENLLPWMTGAWSSSTYQFTFDADGTVRRSLGVALGGGCASTVSATGPVTQEGDLLIMDFGPETARSCNTPVEGGPAKRVRYRIEWVEVADYSTGSEQHVMKLRLRDVDCPGGGDCTELMTRR